MVCEAHTVTFSPCVNNHVYSMISWSSNFRGEVYLIQHCMIKCAFDLSLYDQAYQQFDKGLWFPRILCLNSYKLPTQSMNFFFFANKNIMTITKKKTNRLRRTICDINKTTNVFCF